MTSISDQEIQEIVRKVLSQSSSILASPAPSNQPAPASKKIVAIGADHGGYDLKEILKKDIAELGYTVLDVGTTSKEAVDYPDYAFQVAQQVASGKAWRGVMIDGAGIGSCIVANKVPGFAPEWHTITRQRLTAGSITIPTC